MFYNQHPNIVNIDSNAPKWIVSHRSPNDRARIIKTKYTTLAKGKILHATQRGELLRLGGYSYIANRKQRVGYRRAQ